MLQYFHQLLSDFVFFSVPLKQLPAAAKSLMPNETSEKYKYIKGV